MKESINPLQRMSGLNFLLFEENDLNLKIKYRPFDQLFFFLILNFQKICLIDKLAKHKILLKNFFFSNYYQWNYFLEIIYFLDIQKKKLSVNKIFYGKFSKMLIYLSVKTFFLKFFNYEFFQINWNIMYFLHIKNYEIFMDQRQMYSATKWIKILSHHVPLVDLKIFQDQNFIFNEHLFKKLYFKKFSENKVNIFKKFSYVFSAKILYGFGKYIFFVFTKIFKKKKNYVKHFFFLKQILKEAELVIQKERKKNCFKKKEQIMFKKLWVETNHTIFVRKSIIRKKKLFLKNR